MLSMAIEKKTPARGKSPVTPATKAATAKRAAAPKAAKPAGAKTAAKKPAQDATKDPKGGLTAAGRKAFAAKDGSDLKPGVRGAADTPEKLKRKGSFLTRHFTNPSGPMVRDGEPTRLALSAHAWGEPVPKTEAAAKKLAAKGRKLLEQYQAGKPAKKASAKKASAKKAPAKKSPTKK